MKRRPNDRPPTDPDGEQVPPPPVTFWMMIGLAVLYLGWRLVQGILWLADRLF